jgi:hypothetical protein
MTDTLTGPPTHCAQVDYAFAPPAKTISFQARLELLHRIRSHLDHLCSSLRITEEGKALYHNLLVAANGLEYQVPAPADPTATLAQDWAQALLRAEPSKGDPGADAQLLHSIIPSICHDLGVAGEALPVDRTFEMICGQAEAAYRVGYHRAQAPGQAPYQCAPTPEPTPALRGIPPRLVLAPLKSMPGPDPYAVTGHAVRYAGSKRAPEVKISVYVERFGPESYAALPCAIAHEVVCHALAGHTENKDKPETDSSFAEGMMDWVAWGYLCRWMQGLSDQTADGTTIDHKDVGWGQVAVSHGTLLMRELPARSPAGRKQIIGRTAAQYLLGWFASHLGLPPDECWHEVAILAVALNVVPADLALKDHLVTQLHGRLPLSLERALAGWVDGTASAEDVLQHALWQMS